MDLPKFPVERPGKIVLKFDPPGGGISLNIPPPLPPLPRQNGIFNVNKCILMLIMLFWLSYTLFKSFMISITVGDREPRAVWFAATKSYESE